MCVKSNCVIKREGEIKINCIIKREREKDREGGKKEGEREEKKER